MTGLAKMNGGKIVATGQDPMKEWVSKDSLLKQLDKTWNKINNCEMHRVRFNYITKSQVAAFLGELKKEIEE